MNAVPLATEIMGVHRGLARREDPTCLLAGLLASLKRSTNAAIVGVQTESGAWVLPDGPGSSQRTRLERALSTPTPSEWVVDVPVEDAGRYIGRLVMVLPTGPGAVGRGGISFDTTQLVHGVSMLLIAIEADGSHHTSVTAPATRTATEPDTPLVAGLRRDLAAGRFVPHFQPVVELGTGKVAAFDALVRWNQPQRGWISAAEFFPQAKKAGLVAELESVVFKQAAMRARGWLDRGAARVRVNVKVSGDRFESPELLEELIDLIGIHHLPAATIGLMVTEKTLARPRAIAALPSMRDAGFRITLEHFGTTATTAASLRSLPLYGIKIDRSIVERLPDDPAAMRAARAVVQAARTLDLKTIGEGIETEGQRQALEELGCTAGQGFLWSPAVESEVADSIMRFQTFAARAARQTRLATAR